MKQCKGCGATKPFDDYYRHPKMRDGRLNYCKVCRVKASRENYAANRERYREYDRQRAMLPHRVEMRKRYQSTDAGKAAVKRAHEKFKARNPEKRAAHVALGNAVRRGKILKPKTCSSCNAGGRIHGHHDDYSKPLDVQWLCAACHVQRHRELA